MGNINQISVKNRTYYFFNGMINIKEFDSNQLKIDKKLCKSIGFYYINFYYYENINSVNPLYLIIVEEDIYIEENKDLTFASTDKSKNC